MVNEVISVQLSVFCSEPDDVVAPGFDRTYDVASDASIELVFEPEWDKSRMSEEALLELGWL